MHYMQGACFVWPSQEDKILLLHKTCHEGNSTVHSGSYKARGTQITHLTFSFGGVSPGPSVGTATLISCHPLSSWQSQLVSLASQLPSLASCCAGIYETGPPVCCLQSPSLHPSLKVRRPAQTKRPPSRATWPARPKRTDTAQL